jgi:hypothetical protein
MSSNRSPSAAVADPFDPECFDFVAYVARCHGLERPDAAALVARWLRTYEPSPQARRAFGNDGPKSGIRYAAPAEEQLRTGTA